VALLDARGGLASPHVVRAGLSEEEITISTSPLSRCMIKQLTSHGGERGSCSHYYNRLVIGRKTIVTGISPTTTIVYVATLHHNCTLLPLSKKVK
jgi:hypothetical protein